MEIQGKIIAALDVKTGVSARGEWKVQEFVLETLDMPHQRVVRINGVAPSPHRVLVDRCDEVRESRGGRYRVDDSVLELGECRVHPSADELELCPLHVDEKTAQVCVQIIRERMVDDESVLPLFRCQVHLCGKEHSLALLQALDLHERLALAVQLLLPVVYQPVSYFLQHPAKYALKLGGGIITVS